MFKDNPFLKDPNKVHLTLKDILYRHEARVAESNRINALKNKATDKQIGGDHYKSMPIQPGEFIRKNGIGWYEGNAIKYICRHKLKHGRQDLEKAIHYLELALEEYE